MENNDKQLQPDFLNETVQSNFIPTITSTGIKERKSKKLSENFNFEDSVIYASNDQPEQLSTPVANYKNKNYYGIEPKYLQRTKPPEILMDRSFDDPENSFVVVPQDDLSICKYKCLSKTVSSNSEWLANTFDEDYFRQHTKPLSKMPLMNTATRTTTMTSGIKSIMMMDNAADQNNKENNEEFGLRLRREEIRGNLENTIGESDGTLNYSVSTTEGVTTVNDDNNCSNFTLIDGLLDENEEGNNNNSQSKLFDVTRLAYEFENLEKLKNEKKNSQKNLCCLTNRDDQIVEVNKGIINIQLLADKNCLLWTGVPVQNNESKPKHEQILAWLHHNQIIKSFKLNLRANQSVVAKVSINQSSNTFHFTNQFGNDYQNSKEITLEPLQDKKLYIVFHPTNSAYHDGMIIVNLGTKKFKVRLFGYAESAKVELVDFQLSSDLQENCQKLLVKNFPSVVDKNKKTIQLFNSGARTAYVAFFSHEQSVRFQPRSFLLIPKTTKEIKVSSGNSNEKITFFFIHVDEELRRACRKSCTEYRSKPNKHKYNHFNVLQIFAFLPEENDIQQYSLPNYDWRPSLIRQINTSICYGLMNAVAIVDTNSTIRSSLNEMSTPAAVTDASVRTIDQRTAQSSVTGNSTLSNIENLNSKTLYLNSAASFINGLSDTLNGVVVLKDVNRFPDTPLGRESYLGILIRNNNFFPVHWFVSDLLLTGSGNSNSPETCSSRYSLSSWPKKFPAACMSSGMEKGVLKSFDAVVIPVKFRPTSLGLTECKCNVRVFTTTDESFIEKEIDFTGEAIRQDNSLFDFNKFIPDFSVSPQSINFSYNQPGKLIERKLQLHNTSNHIKEIFLSQVGEPFHIRATRVCIEKGKSLISIYFNSKKKGIFEDVLLLSDDEGHSLFVPLRGELK